jgi:glycosyltransferase involved in cell wall biosynthesis
MRPDVVHLIHQFPPESQGGSEHYLRDLVGRQRSSGRSVEVISGTKHWRPSVEWTTDEVDGVPVHRVHRDDSWIDHHARIWHPGVERTFEDYLRKRRPALVHVHHWIRLTSNLVEVCRRQGIPCVVTLHDYYTSCPRIFRSRPDDPACQRPISASNCATCVTKYGHETHRELETGVELYADNYRAELAMADAVLVSVGSTADLLSRTTGTPRERYEVLPLGYRNRFAGLPPLAAPQPGSPIRFAFWGIVGRHKGILVLLRAMRAIAESRPGLAELHVLGSFESPEFEAEVRAGSEGLPVVVHGRFESQQLHAVNVHVGVFPSVCIETYGQVLDECWELRLPHVVSDVGALGGRAGSSGLRVLPGDEGSLTAAMLRFIDEPDLWRTQQALLPATPLDRDAHAEALEVIYERCKTAGPTDRRGAPVDSMRRIEFLQMQRDSAVHRLSPNSGPS